MEKAEESSFRKEPEPRIQRNPKQLHRLQSMESNSSFFFIRLSETDYLHRVKTFHWTNSRFKLPLSLSDVHSNPKRKFGNLINFQEDHLSSADCWYNATNHHCLYHPFHGPLHLHVDKTALSRRDHQLRRLPTNSTSPPSSCLMHRAIFSNLYLSYSDEDAAASESRAGMS